MKGSIRVGIWCVFVLSTLHADFAAAQSLQWARTYQGPLLEIGTGAALAPDEGGLYAVAVRTDWAEANHGGVARKLDADGKVLWVKGLAFAAWGVAVARDGFVYVAGTRAISPSVTVAVLRKMRPDGAVVWERYLPGTGGTASEGTAVAVARGGAVVWVGGSERTAAGKELSLACYRADGTHLRSFRHRPARGNNSSVGGLALDPDGNVVIAGSSETNDAYGTSASAALVAKFSREGTLAWARYLPDDTRHSERYAWGKDIAVGLDGSLYVAASRYGASMDAVLWKLAPQSGQILWKRTFATEDSDNLLGVAVRPGSGEICAAGVLGVFSATPNPALVACYSPDGVESWRATYLSPAPGLAAGYSLALGRNGATYVTGTMTSTGASGANQWVAKYR